MGKRLATVLVPLILTCFHGSLAAPQTDQSPSLEETLGSARSLLLKHYKARLMVQNYKPAISARFVPLQFDSCDLKWRLVAPITQGSLTMEVTLNLGDLDPSDIMVLKSDVRRNDQWHFELRTLNEQRKIKVERIVRMAKRIRERNMYQLTRAGFGADTQEVAQEIADKITSAIKQCSAGR